MDKRQDSTPPDEQRVDLALFWRDGTVSDHPGQGRTLPRLTAGRTDSREGLGFELEDGGRLVRFVLDGAQIRFLRRYLEYQARRIIMKPTAARRATAKRKAAR